MRLALLYAHKYLVLHNLRRVWKSKLVYYRTGYYREQLLLAGFTRLALDETAWPAPGTPNSLITIDLSKHPHYRALFEYTRVRLGVFLRIAAELRIDTDEESLRLRDKALKQINEFHAIEGQLMSMHNWYYIGGFQWDSNKELIYYYLSPGGLDRYNSGHFSVRDFKLALQNKGRIIRKKSK